jgi:hypothetical protein
VDTGVHKVLYSVLSSKIVRFRRKRKEIRTLSERERENFFDAVNALKKDRVSDKHCHFDYTICYSIQYIV